VVKGKKPVRKKTQQIEVTPELVVESKDPDAIPNFSEDYASWADAAGKFTLNMGRTDTNILEFIQNMGVKSRTSSDGTPMDVKAPTQEYIDKAKLAGSKRYFSEAQIQAITDLQKYLEDARTNAQSKVNPANIKFNDIRSYNKQGKVLTRKPIYGDFRTPKYVKYQRRYKDRTVDNVPPHWYSKKPKQARPPVWQALFADKIEDFKHPSLLAMCNDFIEAIPKVEFVNKPEKPLRLRALERGRKKGVAAKWVYENISEFKNWFDSKMNNPAYTVKTSGNFASRKVHRELIDEGTKRAKIPFKLSDAESVKLLEWLGSSVKLDLDNAYLDISRRQIDNMAEIAGFKNKKTDDGIEKQDFSDWRQIVKAVQ
jgi:hypothetical protein